MTAVVVAGLLGVAVLLGRPARVRLPAPAPATAAVDDRAPLLRLRPLLAALCLVAGWVVLGGVPGAAIGAVAAVAAWRVLAGAEGPAARARRAELEQDLPLAVHLLGACLEAGAAPSSAVRAVADALPGAVSEELRTVVARLDLGMDPVAVWRTVAAGGPLAPLGRALARAHETGASVTGAVQRLSVDLRASAGARTAARARTVEVRAAGPLGACFLPAFLLLGVVPMAVGIFSSLHLLG